MILNENFSYLFFLTNGVKKRSTTIGIAIEIIGIVQKHTVLICTTIWITGSPNKVSHRCAAGSPVPLSFPCKISPWCPPVPRCFVVGQKNELSSDEVQLHACPDLNKRCIFISLTVVVGLLPGVGFGAVEKQTAQPSQSCVNPVARASARTLFMCWKAFSWN